MSNVDLLDGASEWGCLAAKAKAIAIAPHIYTATLRVYGRGRWRKSPDGPWILERFVIDDFDIVRFQSIDQTINELRAIKAKWKTLDDPLAALMEIRSGPGETKQDADGSIRQ